MGQRKRGHARRWSALALAGAGLWLAAGGMGEGQLSRLQALAQSWDIPRRILALRLGAEDDAITALAASPALSALTVEDREEEGWQEVALREERSGATASPEAEEEPEETLLAEEEAEEQEEQEEQEEPAAIDLTQISLNNGTEAEVDLEAVAALNTQVDLASEGPQILIMHTHGTEAYTPTDGDSYTPSDSYRTTDGRYNMLRVGEEIADALEEAGYSVLHDTTLYDYPAYTGSYARARAGIQALMEEYPSISLVIDVHRDALISSDGTAYKVLTTLDGEKTAQLMLVVGTDQGGLDHPNWRGNLSFALQVQKRLLELDTTLPREINLRTSRFNQDLTPGSLLVEVGSCGNTLEEALAGGRRFAAALDQALEGG